MTEIETKYLERTIQEHTQDMTGQVVAITGTTSGTGYVCARELGKLGAQVLLLNRESTRASEALQKLIAEVPEGKFTAISCDLQDFDSVRRAAQEIAGRFERLDVLCNNAAVMAFPEQATKDGYDIQMQTNSMAPFLLTKELFPLLKRSKEGRVVNHTSAARLGSNHETRYFQKSAGNLGGDGTVEQNAHFGGPRWERYHQSKLANCTFTYGLVARLAEKGVTNVRVMIAHPGLARTGLQTASAGVGGMDLESEIMKGAQSSEDGALGIIRACADPSAESGDFFGPNGWTGFAEKLSPEPLLLDPENIRILFEGCEAAFGAFEI